jgi:hypothetical protein
MLAVEAEGPRAVAPRDGTCRWARWPTSRRLPRFSSQQYQPPSTVHPRNCSFPNLCALAAILMHVNAHNLSFIGRGRSVEETEFSSLPWVSLHCRAHS